MSRMTVVSQVDPCLSAEAFSAAKMLNHKSLSENIKLFKRLILKYFLWYSPGVLQMNFVTQMSITSSACIILKTSPNSEFSPVPVTIPCNLKQVDNFNVGNRYTITKSFCYLLHVPKVQKVTHLSVATPDKGSHESNIISLSYVVVLFSDCHFYLLHGRFCFSCKA